MKSQGGRLLRFDYTSVVSLGRLFVLPPDPQYRSRIVQAVRLCVFVLYGVRALEVEVLRWGFVAVPILLCGGGLAFGGAIYWFNLLFHGLRALLTPARNGLLLLVLVVGAGFAWFTPEPPLREEIKLLLNRSRYEEVAERGRSTYLAGKHECVELAHMDQDLAWNCVSVAGNHAIFEVYRDVFSLVYSYDEQVPTAADCDWNGSVWKRIDSHWFICKSSINDIN